FRAGGVDFALQLRKLSVTQFRGTLQISFALRARGVFANLFELRLRVGDLCDDRLLALPLRFQSGDFFLQLGDFAFDLVESLLRYGIGFARQRLLLDLQLGHTTRQLVDLLRHRRQLDAQTRGRFVDEVDCLIGKESVGDVAMRQRGRGDDRRVGDLHAVMHFVALFQSAQDADRVFHRRFADVNGLEAALKRGIFFDVLLIFVERRRADGAQLAARERRLEHVRRVHRSFGRAGADERVQLVDEENDVSFALFDFFDDRLQTIFELAAIFRAGNHGAEVEGDDALVLETFGDVAFDDASRQTFDDGGLPDARLADENRIVLRATRQHLNDAADFFIASDDRIEFAAPRELRQIARISLERLILIFRILIGDALRAAHRLQRFEHRVGNDAVSGENARRRRRFLLRDGKK